MSKANTPTPKRKNNTPSIVRSIGQSKRWRVIESLFNAIGGYFIAVLAQMIIFPLFDVHLKPEENLLIAFFFLIVSVCRSYCFRRFFNLLQTRNNNG